MNRPMPTDRADHAVAPYPQDPLRYIDEPRELIGGNAVKLLPGGAQVFPAWLAAIGAAIERISLEMYIFSADTIGRKVAAALVAAVGRGVLVNVMYDFVGCRDTPASFFQELRDKGVHVIAYHKYRFWRPRFWTLVRRNHRKTLVVDGKLGFTGGLNISDEWAPRAEGGGGWHDAVVQVEGPAVARMEEVFLQTWNRRARKRARIKSTLLLKPANAGQTRLAVISNKELLDRFAIRRSALQALRESRERVLLANPYFVPDQGVLRALANAAGRGVTVSVVLPARSDVRLLDIAGRHVFGPLLAAGVRIFQTADVLHTKALAVDRVFASIGSYNFDHRSLAYNLEMVVNVIDEAYNADVVGMLSDEITKAAELTLEMFQRRSWLTRLIERLAYSLRNWM
jgi:cardiolipin synthase